MKNGTVSARMYQTRIDLPETTRRRSIESFNQLLASCLDLYTQVKQAHWNVKGKDFYQVHILFDEVATAVFEPIDLLAERITALGGIAHGTVMDAAENSAIPRYPDTDAMTEIDHLNALADRLAVFAKQVRAAMDRTASWHDQGSSDICTQISREIDQKLWFVEAHLQESRMRSLTA
ncbi:MAG TPA: DNA starvation/stationary phase protection protein Dps [Chroococcales cyanobacterium]